MMYFAPYQHPVQLAYKTLTNQPTQVTALKFYAQPGAAAAAAARAWPSLQTQAAHLHPTKDHMVVSYGSFIPAVRRSGGQ